MLHVPCNSNIEQLAATQSKVLLRDTIAFLQAGRADSMSMFDIVFIDPPYRAELAEPCCALLEQGHWLAPRAKIYVECATASELVVPQRWQLLKQKRAGQVAYYLFAASQE